MGYNSVVLILNDGFDQIEKHPEEFISSLRPLVVGGILRDEQRHPYGKGTRDIGDGPASFGVGNHGNPAAVINVAHADATQVILVGQNSATLLGEAYYTGGHHTRDGVKESLNQVLKEYGLKVIEDTKFTKGPGNRT